MDPGTEAVASSDGRDIEAAIAVAPPATLGYDTTTSQRRPGLTAWRR
jgi:hypothetical protein